MSLDNKFSVIETRTDVVKRKKELDKKSSVSTSQKPLSFEVLDGDSPLKVAIIEKINEAGLTYSDLYEYTTEKMFDGDTKKGQSKATNIISGLNKRNDMMGETFYILCDFVGFDILLVPKQTKSDDDEVDEGE